MGDDFRTEFLPRHNAAHEFMIKGDPEPWLAVWSDREPVSVFGGFGYVSHGQEAVRATVRKAASRMSGGSNYRNEVAVADVRGDLAYTVSIESCDLSTDGGQPTETRLRVTQLYRREGGRWRVVHRHGDIIRDE